MKVFSYEPFLYQDKELYVEQVKINDIAKHIPTPFYCYAQNAILKQFYHYKNAFRSKDLIAYALKANSHQAILRILKNAGAGADIVSQGELFRAEKAGIPLDKIIYSGVGKTKEEIDYALNRAIKCFNVESKEELYFLQERAKATNKIAPISLRINPNIDAQTHEKISTGKAENKFGIALEDAFELYKQASTLPNLAFKGVDIHIGSQISTLTPFEKAFAITKDFIKALNNENIHLDHIDIGGGLGIAYDDKTSIPAIEDYARCALRYFEDFPGIIICEPGRNIIGNAGVLIVSVLYVKKTACKNFIIVDGAMNDLIRPTLYNAWQEIAPVHLSPEKDIIAADIVGPICETGDYFALDRQIIEPAMNNLLCIYGAGAYGAAMASTYNSRPIAGEVLVDQQNFAIIREKISYQELIAHEKLPNWLEKQ